MDIDSILEDLYKCKLPSESDALQIMDKAIDLFIEEPNVLNLESPITLCGDVHGQFYDLLVLFEVGGFVPNTRYLFLGDYVDRGYYSIEILLLLITLKVKYPSNIFLIRGNHESMQTTQFYGFYDECTQKYDTLSFWRKSLELFDYMTISALVDNRLFCVHGGLSPDIEVISEVQYIDRNQEVPHSGPMCDLLWSDPEDGVETWMPNQRGAGVVFGAKQVREFNTKNGLDLLARAHQLCDEGYNKMFDFSLVTVWSAPNYFYRCDNSAAVMEVGSGSGDIRERIDFKVFEAAPAEKRVSKKFERPFKTQFFL